MENMVTTGPWITTGLDYYDLKTKATRDLDPSLKNNC